MAAQAPRLPQFAVHVDEVSRARAVMEIVHVLGDEEDLALLGCTSRSCARRAL
jgi:hypothetical protein